MKKRSLRWKSIGVLTIIALLLVSVITGCGSQTSGTSQDNTAGNKSTINIGYVTWAEDIAVSNLWKQILEDQGYTVKLTQLDVAPLFVGLSKNDVNVFMDSWLPITHETYWNQYKDKLQDLGTWYEGEAKIGLVVPSYVSIDSISQLNNEKTNFNGQIIGIDPGAGIMKATEKAIKDSGLDFKLVQGSEAAMMAALDTAYRDNKWIAITGWSPHWMFAKYKLKYLKDDTPNQDYGKAEGIHTLINSEFAQNNPKLAEMFKKFKMNDQQIGSLEDLIKQDSDHPQNAVKKWLENSDNKKLMDSWIK